MSAATEILDLEKARYQKLRLTEKEHYLGFPPSNAVDGRYDTAFRSLESEAFHGILRFRILLWVSLFEDRREERRMGPVGPDRDAVR